MQCQAFVLIVLKCSYHEISFEKVRPRSFVRNNSYFGVLLIHIEFWIKWFNEFVLE